MGGNNSKEPEQNNFMRRSSTRVSRRQRASSISLSLKQLRQQMETFDGYRDDPRYTNFQSILTKSSQDIQNLKHKSKPDTQQFCDNVHADIIDLLRVLEQVVSKNEHDLDSGAVESHSFIDQTPNMKKREKPLMLAERVEGSPERSEIKSEKSDGSSKSRPELAKASGKYTQRITNLDQLEQNVSKLSKEVDNAIELEDKKQFVMLEKKISLLYTDLEMIEVDEHTPLHQRKESISRKLIRYNNRLRKAKSNAASHADLPQAISEEEKNRRAQRELEIIVPIEQDMEDLEVKVLLFDDVKGTPKYKELDQTIKSHWSTLQQLESSSESNRKRKLKTLDAIKKILQALNSKSEENASKITTSIEKVISIEDDLLSLTKSVENFDGTRNGEEYKNLDQKLRSLWAKLNDIHGAYEKVENRKGETIALVQEMLKALLQNAQSNEQNAEISGNTNSESTDHNISIAEQEPLKNILNRENYDFLMQTKELQNHWLAINKTVVQKLSSTDKKDIVQVLDSLTREINKKIRDIQAMSTNSFRGIQDIKNRNAVASDGNILSDQAIIRNMNIEESESSIPNQNHIPVEAIKIQESHGSNEAKSQVLSEFQPQDLLIDELANSLKITAQPAEIKTLPTTEIFGQIQKIQIDLKEIKNQIKTYTGTKEDAPYYVFESQLNEHHASLEDVPKNLSQIVDKARTKGLHMVQECLNLLEEKIQENREKIAGAILENIAEQKHQTELLHYNKPYVAKEEAQVQQMSDETNKLKNVTEYLQKVKKRVDCFSGTYKNIQYVQIETELNSCLDKIEQLDDNGNEKVVSSKIQLKEKVRQYLEILDERSLKVASQEDLSESRELPYRQINELRTKLTNIKLAMENFHGEYKDANYIKLEQELINCKKDLENIAEINHSVIVSRKQYGDYINQLQTYFEEKVIAENEDKVDGENSEDPEKLLTQYQQEIIILKQEIDGLQYNITDAQYYNLDENLLQIMLKIDDIEVQDENLNEQRRNLIQELQAMLTTLQGKKNSSNRNSATDNQISVTQVQEIEKEIHDLTQRVHKFPEVNYKDEYDSLDESIAMIFLQIQSVEPKGNPRIIQICEDLIKDVQNNQRILKQKVESARLTQLGGKLGTEV